MERDERLPAEWFRICEYVSLFPRTENLSLYVDSKAGVRGLSFAFALEACYLGLKEETIYTGDSSPLYNFLPTDSIGVAHMRAKASIMSDTDVGYRNMIMKNPISLMSTDEQIPDLVPTMSSRVKDIMEVVPLISQIETSTALLAAERETRTRGR